MLLDSALVTVTNCYKVVGDMAGRQGDIDYNRGSGTEEKREKEGRLDTMNNLEKIRSNIEVHGLKWAAQYWQKHNGNFDTFYYACFHRWPAR